MANAAAAIMHRLRPLVKAMTAGPAPDKHLGLLGVSRESGKRLLLMLFYR